MATDTVSRVIPFPGCDYSPEGAKEYLCPRRREVTEPAKILQFPGYPENEDGEDPPLPDIYSVLDRNAINQIFKHYERIDISERGKLLCYCRFGPLPTAVIKLHEKGERGQRLYLRREIGWNFGLRPEILHAGSALELYNVAEVRFAPFE